MVSKYWGAAEACFWQASNVRHLSVCGVQQGTGAGDMARVQGRRDSWACGADVTIFRACVMDLCLGDIEFFVVRPNVFPQIRIRNPVVKMYV